MGLMTWTRNARCEDCIFLKEFHKDKRKLNKCSNPKSIRYEMQLSKKELVCSDWSLTNPKEGV